MDTYSIKLLYQKRRKASNHNLSFHLKGEKKNSKIHPTQAEERNTEQKSIKLKTEKQQRKSMEPKDGSLYPEYGTTLIGVSYHSTPIKRARIKKIKT